MEYWTLALIPDTHYSHGSDAETERLMAEWVADNIVAENIQLVVHVGDVSNAQYNSPASFHRIVNAAAKNILLPIEEAEVPFLIATGNHDMVGGEAELPNSRVTYLHEEFPSSRYENKSYFAGAYKEGDINNVAYKLAVQGRDYLFICVEMNPRTEVETWANTLLTANPNAVGIIVTHSYFLVDGQTVDADMEGFRSRVIAKHPNIKMTVMGHNHSHYNRVSAHYESIVHMVKPNIPLWGTTAEDGMSICLLKIYENGKVEARDYIPRFDTWVNDTDTFYLDFDNAAHIRPTKNSGGVAILCPVGLVNETNRLFGNNPYQIPGQGETVYKSCWSKWILPDSTTHKNLTVSPTLMADILESMTEGKSVGISGITDFAAFKTQLTGE